MPIITQDQQTLRCPQRKKPFSHDLTPLSDMFAQLAALPDLTHIRTVTFDEFFQIGDATQEISDFLILLNTRCPHINSLHFAFNWFRDRRQISQDLNQFTELTQLNLTDTDIELPHDRDFTPDVFSRLTHLDIMSGNAFHLACFFTPMVQITLQQLEFYYTRTGCTHGPAAIKITEDINRNRKEWLKSLLVIRLCLQGQRQYYHQPLSNCKLKRRERNKRYLRLRNKHFTHNRFLQLPEELVQRISDHLLPTTLANAVHDKQPVNLSPLRIRY